MVKSVFPAAVEHRKRRPRSDCVRDIEAGPVTHGCSLCLAEKETAHRMKAGLELWAKSLRNNPGLSKLLARSCPSEKPEDRLLHVGSGRDDGFRVVHQADIKVWQNVVKRLSTLDKGKYSSASQLQAYVESLAFPTNNPAPDGLKIRLVGRLVGSFQCLRCKDHGLAVAGSMFSRCGNSDQQGGYELGQWIELLSDDEYRDYTKSLAQLLLLLQPDAADWVVDGHCLLDEQACHEYIHDTVGYYHPRIRVHVDNGTQPGSSSVFSLGKRAKRYILSPPVCTHLTCSEGPGLASDPPRGVSIACERTPAQEPTKVVGTAANDPITIESDTEQTKVSPATYNLRVLQYDCSASLPEALRSLPSVSSGIGTPPTGSTRPVRRSTRKRKLHFPSGCFVREDTLRVGPEHNVAALRLLLYETCETALTGTDLTFALATTRGNEYKYEYVDVTTEPTDTALKEVLDGARQKFGINEPIPGTCPFKNVVLLYQKGNIPTSNIDHESVMDALLNDANLEHSIPTQYGNKTKKHRRTRQSERGFRGTLLQSSNRDSTTKIVEMDSVEGCERTPVHTDRAEVKSLAKYKSVGAGGANAPIAEELPGSSTIHTPTAIDSILLNVDEEKFSGHLVAHSDLFAKVCVSLRTIVDQPVNLAHLHRAVTWVLEAHPGENNDEILLDAALAKYLDSGGSKSSHQLM